MDRVSQAAWVWVLEAFDVSDEFLQRWALPGFTDQQAATLLQASDLGFVDLYDITEQAADELGKRFGLDIGRGGHNFMIGRERA